jgi:hypothetical protein
MQSRDFCYWLQGYFEISNTLPQQAQLTKEQVQLIQKHLNLVFEHEIDPSMGGKEHQDELNNIHNHNNSISNIPVWMDPGRLTVRC